jgi:preprotein translocase SecF subunit
MFYLALRYDFRYAPGAILSLIHDPLIVMGIFSLFQLKFTMTIVAALLTIIGYSINDTIVIFDRIRENVEKLKGKSLFEIITKSINETLSRTILTGLTTLAALFAVLVFGGASIRDFSIALLIGIVIGTYSSIAIASPFYYYFEMWHERRKKGGAALKQQPSKATT